MLIPSHSLCSQYYRTRTDRVKLLFGYSRLTKISFGQATFSTDHTPLPYRQHFGFSGRRSVSLNGTRPSGRDSLPRHTSGTVAVILRDVLKSLFQTQLRILRPFAVRKRPRRMLPEASNGALRNVLRGRFAAPQDEDAGFGSGAKCSPRCVRREALAALRATSRTEVALGTIAVAQPVRPARSGVKIGERRGARRVDSDFSADERVHGVAPAAANGEGQGDDAPEERIFEAPVRPEIAGRQMNLDHRHGHHAEHQRGDRAGQETDRQHESAEKFDQAGDERKRRGQAEFGREELAGRIDAVAAEPTKQFLRAVRHQHEAGGDTHQRFGEWRERIGDRLEGGNDGLGRGLDRKRHGTPFLWISMSRRSRRLSALI